MFKFLRKNQTWILAIGGSLLMIVFLIPTAITELSQRSAQSSATIATFANGDEVSATEFQLIQEEMQVFDRLPSLQFQFSVIGGISSPEHWLLLSYAADQAGMIPYGQSLVPADSMAQLVAQTGMRPDAISRTLNKAEGIRQMLDLYYGASEVSDARMKDQVQRLFSAIQLQSIMVEASADAPGLPEPTEADIQQQFDTYKDDLPGEGDRGFGYRYPDRVKLEWIEIDTPSLAQWIEDQGISGIELRRHWISRVGETGANLPPVDNTGGDVPQRVIDDYKRIKARELMNEIRQDMRMEIQATLRELPRANSAYVLPADWESTRVSYEALAAKIQEKHGIPTPTIGQRRDRWYEASEFSTLGQVGFADNEELSPGSAINLAGMVGLLRELGSDSPISQQVGVTLPMLLDFENRLYAVRITDVDPSHAPASLDEVRDDVVRDLKKLAHYEQLTAQRDQMRQDILDIGFLRTALKYESPVQADISLGIIDPGYLNSLRFGQPIPDLEVPPLPVIGRQPEVLNEIVDAILSFDTAILPDVPMDDRLFVVDVDDALAVAIILAETRIPVNENTYDIVAGNRMLQQLIASIEYRDGDSLAETFSEESMTEAFGFIRSRSDDEEELTDEDAPSDSADE